MVMIMIMTMTMLMIMIIRNNNEIGNDTELEVLNLWRTFVLYQN